jgi:hypothetical protein
LVGPIPKGSIKGFRSFRYRSVHPSESTIIAADRDSSVSMRYKIQAKA